MADLKWPHATEPPEWWNPIEGNTLDPTNPRLSEARRDWIVRRLVEPSMSGTAEAHRHMPWGQVPNDPCFFCGVYRTEHL